MKAIITKILAAAATLVLASAPLAASAQNWSGHDHDGNRGGYVQRGGGYTHRGGEYVRGGGYYRGYGRPIYAQPYVNGYFGFAPGGFQGFFWNGGWYHHRRWNGGVWLYF
jgi:hypothetical protein